MRTRRAQEPQPEHCVPRVPAQEQEQRGARGWAQEVRGAATGQATRTHGASAFRTTSSTAGSQATDALEPTRTTRSTGREHSRLRATLKVTASTLFIEVLHYVLNVSGSHWGDFKQGMKEIYMGYSSQWGATPTAQAVMVMLLSELAGVAGENGEIQNLF